MANEADEYDAPVSIPRQRLAIFAIVARSEACLRGLNDQKRPCRHGGTTEDVSATTAKSAKGEGNPLTVSMVRFQKPESLFSQEALDRYCLSEIDNTLYLYILIVKV